MRTDIISPRLFSDKRTSLRFRQQARFFLPPPTANTIGEAAGESIGGAVLVMQASLEEVNALTDEMRTTDINYEALTNVLICAGVAEGIGCQHTVEVDGVRFNIRGVKECPAGSHTEFYLERIQ